jgi:hypothetical protein
MTDVEMDQKAPPGTPPSIKAAMATAKEIWDMFNKPKGKKEFVPRPNPYDDVAEKCVASIKQFRTKWPKMTTEASATDRIGFHGMPLTLQLMTGGGVASTASISPSVTYQGVGRDFAAFVTENTFETLHLNLYVFRDGKVGMGIRPWDLNFGVKYKVTVAPDDDLDGLPDGPGEVSEYSLTQRGKICPLTVDGRRTYIVRLEALENLGEVGLLPDLAMSERDIEYNAEQGYIMMRVHDIGAAAVREVPIAFYEGTPENGRLIGKNQIGELDWPKTFQPETIKFGWNYKPSGAEATFTAVVDPDNQLQEIVETNNIITRTIRFDEKPKAVAKKRPGGGGGGGR